jgi:hypothetical protein
MSQSVHYEPLDVRQCWGLLFLPPVSNQLFGADGVELVLNGRRAFRDYRAADAALCRPGGPQVLREDRRLRPGPDRPLDHARPSTRPLCLRGPRPMAGGRADPLKNRGQLGAPEERPKLRGPAKIGEAAKLRTRPCGYRSIPSAPGLSILTRL